MLNNQQIHQLTSKYGADWTARFIQGTQARPSAATVALSKALQAAVAELERRAA